MTPVWTSGGRFLLAAGASIEATASRKDTAAVAAACHNQLGTLRLLLDHGANPNGASYPEQSRALWTAVSYDRPEVVRLLARYRADLDALDRNGDTALERASLETRNGALVPCLLERGWVGGNAFMGLRLGHEPGRGKKCSTNVMSLRTQLHRR